MQNKILVNYKTNRNKHEVKNCVYLWNGYDDDKANTYSLLKIIEKDSDVYKKNILDFKKKYVNIFLKEVFNDSNNIENKLFYMTNFIESSLEKSLCYTSAIKLLALKTELEKKNIVSIDYLGDDFELSIAIKELCVSLGYNYVPSNKKLRTKIKLLLSLNNTFLKHYLRSLFTIIKVVLKNIILSFFKKSSNTFKDSTLIVSHFGNFSENKLKNKEWYSNYWTELPKLITGNLNWIHILPSTKSILESYKYIKKLSIIKKNKINNHLFLHNFFSIKVLSGILINYFLIKIKFFSIEKKINICVKSQNNSYLWVFFIEKFRDAFIGSLSVYNLYYLKIFENLFSNIFYQKQCLYLLENQPWEKALIHNWKKNNNGKIIGVQHSTVRYWDLRYYDDYKTKFNYSNLIPKPDLKTYNSVMHLNLLKKSKQSLSNCQLVEAHRYLHLNNLSRTYNIDSKQKFILILGEINEDITKNILRIVSKAFTSIKRNYEIIFRPHPMTRLDLSNYQSLNLRSIENKSLSQLLQITSLVISSSSSSSILEAVLKKVPVICVRDNYNLNLSPVKSIYKISYVNNVKDLIKSVDELINTKIKHTRSDKYFILDSKFKRWKKVLN